MLSIVVLKQLRVGKSPLSIGVSFHIFRAEYLYSVSGSEDHCIALLHSWNALIFARIFPKDFRGLNLFIILYVIIDRPYEKILLMFSQSQDQLFFNLALSIIDWVLFFNRWRVSSFLLEYYPRLHLNNSVVYTT